MSFILLGILNSQAAAGGGGFTAVAAYFAGGRDGTPRFDTVDKFDFTDDTRSTLATGLSYEGQGMAGLGNAGVAGYVGPRDTSQTFTTKFAFPSDTRSIISNTMVQTRQGYGSISNSGVCGYFAGGSTSGNEIKSIEKFDFSGESYTSLAAVLTADAGEGRDLVAGANNLNNFGYFMGGGYFSSGYNDFIDKLTFSNDTISSLGTTLSAAKEGGAGAKNGSVAAYYAGGNAGGTITSNIDKITFSDDTRTTLATGLSVARNLLGGVGGDNVCAYFAGGYTTGVTGTSTVDKISFPSETRTTLGTGLSDARGQLAAFGDS